MKVVKTLDVSLNFVKYLFCEIHKALNQYFLETLYEHYNESNYLSLLKSEDTEKYRG